MPLLSLVPPSPWSVFPLFLWRGCWHLPPVSAAPSPAPGAALEQGEDPLVCTKTTRKGQGPKELFWIYFPAVFAWATGWSTWNLPWNRVKCAGWENMFSPRSQWGVFAHPDLAVAVGTSTCLPAWELAAISMILVPHPDPKIPQKIYFF